MAKSDTNKIRKKKQPNGGGSIIKRKDGTWMGRISTGYDENGKLKRQCFYGKTYKEVEEKITKAKYEFNTGTFAPPNKITVSSWLDIWLNQYMKQSLRPSTYTSYEMNIRRHIKPLIGRIKLKDLRRDQIKCLYNSLLEVGHVDGINGLSAKTVHNIHNILHGALDQALLDGLIIKNASKGLKPLRITKPEIRVFTISEQEQFLKVLDEDRLGIAFRLDLATGLRMGELLALRWSDVDLEKGILRVNRSLNRVKNFDPNSVQKTSLIIHETKTKAGVRSIPLPEPIIQDLKLYKVQHQKIMYIKAENRENQLVFLTAVDTPIDPRSFIRKFHSLIKKAGLKHANVHCMRHTYATRLLEANVHIKVVSELLGHTKVSITLDTYSHALPETKRSAADQLSKLFDRNPKENESVGEEVAPYLAQCS